jgi:hypothetical protein
MKQKPPRDETILGLIKHHVKEVATTAPRRRPDLLAIVVGLAIFALILYALAFYLSL